MRISPISVYRNVGTASAVRDPNQVEKSSIPFSDLLHQTSQVLERLDRESAAAQVDLVTGNARDMHTAVLAVEKASLALDLVISVRNRALEAYQEIMRMPL